MFEFERLQSWKVPIYRNMVDYKSGTLFGIFDLSEDEIFK
jgi:hypothetical protein